jgi:hypothetical protein
LADLHLAAKCDGCVDPRKKGVKRTMADERAGASSEARPGHRKVKRIFEDEAYRRIVVGDAPETLSEFAAQLSAWFKQTYPAARAVPISFIEATIRDTWHRRHQVIGSEL